MKKFILLTLLVILSSNLSFSEELKWDNGKIRENKIYYDDEKQFIAEIEYYREDGTIEKTIKYNMDEQVTEIAYTTGKNKYYDGPDGWAVLHNNYDDSGKLMFEAYYDSGGNLIENKGYNRENDLVYKEYSSEAKPSDNEEFNPEPTMAGETIVYD